MKKSTSSGFTTLAVIVILAVAAILVSASYFVISSRINNEQANGTENTASQTDSDKPLDTAASNSANDIEKELNSLTEDDYSDSGLSDTTLYE